MLAMVEQPDISADDLRAQPGLVVVPEWIGVWH